MTMMMTMSIVYDDDCLITMRMTMSDDYDDDDDGD